MQHARHVRAFHRATLRLFSAAFSPISASHPCPRTGIFPPTQGITVTNTETPEELKAKETEAIGKYMERGLSSSDPRVVAGIGGNQLTPPKGEHPCWTFWKHQLGIFSLLLWGGSFLCFIA